MTLKRFASCLVFAAAVAGFGQARAVPVALELALLIDVSGSVETSEYNIQMQGYKAAFQSATIGANIESFAGSGGIAVGVYFFSGGALLSTLGWRQLDSAAEAVSFGNLLGALARPTAGTIGIGGQALNTTTNIAFGVNAAVAGLEANGFEGARRVIDVSGDGAQNTQLNNANVSCGSSNLPECYGLVRTARDAAADLGIVINGLAILNDDPNLATWYGNHLITGPGSFVQAATFATFATAIEAKIGREISNTVPEPGSLALAGLALVAVGAARRRGAAR